MALARLGRLHGDSHRVHRTAEPRQRRLGPPTEVVMKVLAVAALVAAWSIAAGGPGAAAPEGRKELDGTWVVESVTRDPREQNAGEGKGIRCVIRGERLVATLPGEDRPAGTLILKTDPTKKPNAMDIRPAGEKDIILAIYDLQGDTLRVCWSPVGKGRPAEFASPPGSGHSLVVLKREKP